MHTPVGPGFPVDPVSPVAHARLIPLNCLIDGDCDAKQIEARNFEPVADAEDDQVQQVAHTTWDDTPVWPVAPVTPVFPVRPAKRRRLSAAL